MLFLGILFTCTIAVSISLSYSFRAHTTEGSAAPAELSGYAWSSNIGWISFKGSTYGVIINQTNGTLSGYAWSSVGWISFNSTDLVGCPTSPCQAQYSNNQFTGWAKVLSADGNGWDGWDGWIHITGSGYGLSVVNDTITGWMYGGDVVGWIQPKTMTVTGLVDTCTNGIDDDGDGLIDDADVDCGFIVAPPGVGTPGTETTNNMQCNNGVDDDGDAFKDHPADVDCTDINDNLEQGPLTPEVTLKVGIGSASFDTINLGKAGGNVLLSIDVINATTTTTCTGSTVTANATTPFTVTTGGATSYYNERTLVITERTRATVSCQTAGKTGSDSVDIIIKSENEF